MKRHTALLVLMVSALGLPGCLRTLDELTPFPCAKDQSCPDGLVCMPGIGCTEVQLDAPCSPATDCSAAGEGVVCELGLCEQRCAADRSCPEGRVCSLRLAGGVCLADCGAGQDCPAGLACQELRYGGRRGCVPPDRQLPACLGEEGDGEVTQCGAALFDEPCADGSHCARHSVCLPGNRCQCGAGYASFSCVAGVRCQELEGGCSFPDWWCLPLDTWSLCPLEGFALRLFQCADGRRLRSGCPLDTCEEACAQPFACDVVEQRCAEDALPKCTLAAGPAGDALVCVAEQGQSGPDQPCQLPADAAPGQDDCARGSLCTELGAPPGEQRCRRFCASSTGCPPGSYCHAASDEVAGVGLCAPGCTLFSDCGAGMTCSLADELGDRAVPWCRPIGPSSGEAPCSATIECGADRTCVIFGEEGRCVPHCDDAPPCPEGSGCHRTLSDLFPPGAGFCSP